MHSVKKINEIVGYKISLTFEDKKTKIFDAEPYLDEGEVFLPLLDLDYFNLVKVEHGTIVWPNGADFCAYFLYEIGTEKIELELKDFKGLKEFNPTEDLLNEELIEKAILECLGKKDYAGIIEMILIHIEAVRKYGNDKSINKKFDKSMKEVMKERENISGYGWGKLFDDLRRAQFMRKCHAIAKQFKRNL